MDKNVNSLISRIKQDKKLIFIVALGILGMLLLLFSGMGGSDEKNGKNESVDGSEIAVSIEKKLTSLVESVDGAGKVKVMITLESLEERIAAINTESESGEASYEKSDEYVLIEKSGDSDGLILKTITPTVRGVGITCTGADSNEVKQEIIRLVSSTLGIPVNKIWVTTMKE